MNHEPEMPTLQRPDAKENGPANTSGPPEPGLSQACDKNTENSTVASQGGGDDPEASAQAANYQRLILRIAQARQLGQDFELRGAKQISLYRWKDSRRFKAV